MDKVKWTALAVLVLGALLGSVAIARPSLAAKGHSHGSVVTAAVAGCSMAPNPATTGELVTVSGSGFWANSYVGVSVTGPFGTSLGAVLTDAEGAFSYSGPAGKAGTYTATFWSPDETITATCTLEVV